MKTITYRTKGVCSSLIEVTLTNDNIVESVTFRGGCAGNTQGVAALVVGMSAEEAIKRIKGIRCGFKPTSCPDQLALALSACAEQAPENA